MKFCARVVIGIILAWCQIVHGEAYQHEQRDTNITFTNPILPGFHPDPSCIFVEELDRTFFCASSSFLTFPGIPIYASRDLQNWKLVSRVFNRPTQIPALKTTLTYSSEGGIWAPTLRHHNGTFYLICTFVHIGAAGSRNFKNFVFTTPSLFDEELWSDPVEIEMHGKSAIDPDLFWHQDGTAYMHTGWGRIYQQTVDLQTGESSVPVVIWNGTGASNPESPHIFQREDYYYLLIAQGGTGQDHAVAVARSRNISGPYESYTGNPILTAAGTDRFFQATGHADLFQDSNSNWWGVALGKRSGPDYQVYPMGRETLLYAVSWSESWPILDAIFGKMQGWAFNVTNTTIPGVGLYIDAPDRINFGDSEIPPHWVYWRFPDSDAYSISPTSHPGTLEMVPSFSNLTGNLTTAGPISFIGRRQTASLFHFSVIIEYEPLKVDEEAGVTAFVTQLQHIDLGILRDEDGNQVIKLQTTYDGATDPTPPSIVVQDLPETWYGQKMCLNIQMSKPDTYTFSVSLAADPSDLLVMGDVNAIYLSGGSGSYTGVLLGAYNTINGGNGSSKAWFNEWTYTPKAQEVDIDVFDYI